MQLSSTLFAVFVAFSGLVAAAKQNDAREKFKEQSCLSQACRDSVDSGCPLTFINFELGGCDDPGQ